MKQQAIELTSKKYKLLSRLGGWFLVIGVVLISQEPTMTNMSITALALIAFLWGRIGKWWHHE